MKLIPKDRVIGASSLQLAQLLATKVVREITSGTATVIDGQTHAHVAHGLATTPTRVQVTPTLLSAVTHWWVSDKGASEFIINVDQDPGAGTATFDWRAQVGEG